VIEPKLKVSEPEFDLAEHIRRVSDGVRRLLASGLKKNAVIVLLAHDTGVGMRNIEKVIDGIAELAKKYTTTPTGGKS